MHFEGASDNSMTFADDMATAPRITDEQTALSGPDRRALDRRRQPPVAVFAGFLAGRPQLDDSLRMLVAMLAWPLGVKGALLLNRSPGSAPVAMCTEQLEFWVDPFDRARWLKTMEEQLGAEDGRRFRVCEPANHQGLPAAACCALGPGSRPLAQVVLILAAPVSVSMLQQMAAPALDQLAVYLAGNPSLHSHSAGNGNSGDRAQVVSGGLHFSTRQRQVLEMLEQNLTMRQIAARIGYSDSTVRMDSLAIYRALGVHDRDGAISAARAAGLLDDIQ